MTRFVRPPRILLATYLAVSACAAPTEERAGGAPGPDAASGVDGAVPPREKRTITLTLPPIYDRNEGPEGFGDFVSVGDVEVCVFKTRPWRAAWEDFLETGLPCIKSVPDENVVLKDVPAESELLVTAKKDGYWPSVFAVTTGRWDAQNTTQFAHDRWLAVHWLGGTPWADIPPDVAPSPESGIMVTGAIIVDVTRPFPGRYWAAAGVTVALHPPPPPGSGPFYWESGKLEPGAASTPHVPLVPAYSERTTSGATFVNLPEAEYEVTMEQTDAFCQIGGSGTGTVYWGFASMAGATLRAPVLAGYITPAIGASCFCDDPVAVDLATGGCTAHALDGGLSP